MKRGTVTPATAERILVVGPSWVGDMMMAQSLFKVLRSNRTDCRIDVLAPAWSRALLARMPEVHEAIDSPFGHGVLDLAGRRRLGQRLRPHRYDQAIVLPNSFKSALVPLWAGIPRRTGYVGELRYGLLNDARRLDRERLKMTVQRFIALALEPRASLPEPIPEPRLTVATEAVAASLAALGLERPTAPLLALCPGAEYGPAKRWPEAHYAALARQRLAAGWQVWLFGSDRDREVCATINHLCDGACNDLSGRTSLGQAIDLLSLAHAAVSNDSGLMHVVAALQRPLVAVYGSSDPGFTPPLSPRARIARLGLACSPCFKRVCPLGHLDCLQRLEPARIDAELDRLLSDG